MKIINEQEKRKLKRGAIEAGYFNWDQIVGRGSPVFAFCKTFNFIAPLHLLG